MVACELRGETRLASSVSGSRCSEDPSDESSSAGGPRRVGAALSDGYDARGTATRRRVAAGCSSCVATGGESPCAEFSGASAVGRPDELRDRAQPPTRGSEPDLRLLSIPSVAQEPAGTPLPAIDNGPTDPSLQPRGRPSRPLATDRARSPRVSPGRRAVARKTAGPRGIRQAKACTGGLPRDH